MKIIYTTSEAIRELATAIKQDEYFGTDVTVEIVPDRAGVHSLEAYALMVAKFNTLRFFDKKLDAIRYLRELLPIGLADAKYVVEATEARVLSYYTVKKTLDGFAIHAGL
jgi:ribosomal protein L7/L12